jgi:methylaspartate mutase epsilon subunit
MAIPDKSNFINDFSDYRTALLKSPWLRNLDPDECMNFVRGLDESRFASIAYKSKQKESPFIQPRGGVAIFEKQLELTNALFRAGADFIPLTIDSLTRHNDYARASALAELSEKEDKQLLNGYPLVSHGHELTRLLYKDIDRPISLRHGTPDARVLVEVALASGITEIEGGGLCYSLPYSREYPIDRALLNWQYVDRLCAEYSTEGRFIHRESFGPLTATMVPPMMVIVIQVLELLSAAEQGVNSFAVSFGQTGSIDQDIATARALRNVATNCLKTFGFDHVQLRLVYHQWMGAFPTEKVEAEGLISVAAIVAAMTKADKIVTKTYQEAIGVPTPQANADGIRLVRYIFEHFTPLGDFQSSRSVIEEQLISSQAMHLLDIIFNMPENNLWESIHHAVSKGIIDIPFAPHSDNNGQLITIRDKYRAIRILKTGNVPFKKEDIELENELLGTLENNSSPLYRKLLDDIILML